MIYFELVEQSLSNRGNIVPMSEIRTAPRDFEAYVSMFGFSHEILDHIAITKSVKDFAGLYHANQIIIDFDNQDQEQSRQSAIKFIQRLLGYGCTPDNLRIYFSGGKGFHISMPDKLFGGINPAKDLPYKIGSYVELLTAELPDIDRGIYNPNRIIRLANSRHKSGFYKIPISAKELFDLHIDEIKKLAEQPRPDFTPAKKLSDILHIKGLSQIAPAPPKATAKPERDGDRDFFAPANQGGRNNAYLRQAIRLFAHSELGASEIQTIIENANQASNDPLDHTEIKSVIRQAQNYVAAKITPEKEQGTSGKLFAELIPEWLESIARGKKHYSLLIPEIDKDLRHNLEGKLIPIMGKGGSRKSLYAQNVLIYNAVKYGARGIYSNMEMGNVPLMNRAIDILLEPEKFNASFEIEIEELKTPGFAKEALEGYVAPQLADKFIFLDTSAMTAEDYDKVLERETERNGKIDFLVVDGLSMMGGSGGETEVYSRNTKELKELAKKWRVCVLLLCHVTKEPDKTVRDLAPYVRGSEKILDNADCYISLSLCIDPRTGNQDEPEYIDSKGYIHFYNKRMTGRTFRSIYNLDPERLKIDHSPENPEAYEYVKRKSSNPF